jgi:hypothetical protein
VEIDYDEYRNKLLENPEFKIKYLYAKEKLNIELMIDSIDEGIEKNRSPLALKRRVNKLRNHIAALSL